MITVAVMAAVIVALAIINLFVPVKYLAAYCVMGNKGAKQGEMRVRFVDVGYGDCTIIELPDGKNMLIDCGNGRFSNQQRILRFLNKCGIKKIDYLICTSVRAEHCGGLAEIVGFLEVDKAYIPSVQNAYITEEYGSFISALEKRGVTTAVCEYGAGETSAEYGYFFFFLAPSPRAMEEGKYGAAVGEPSDEDIAASSAVLWLEYGATSFLFASDVNSAVEEEICAEYTREESAYFFDGKIINLRGCDVIKVAAHGGDSARSTEFYELLAPQTAIISTGDSVAPDLGVLTDVINSVGVNLYRTDNYGTVTISATAEEYSVV